jgi:hypothetical protein
VRRDCSAGIGRGAVVSLEWTQLPVSCSEVHVVKAVETGPTTMIWLYACSTGMRGW